MGRLSLLPHDEHFFGYFEEAANIMVAAAETLEKMLDDFGHAEVYRKQISDLEHKGDTVIHKVMDKLNRTFVTPLDPEDIRGIASHLDDVIDYIQAASERLVLYQVVTPHQASNELAKLLVVTTKEVRTVIFMLRDLRQRKEIVTHCIEINRLENAGDKIYREALGQLFKQGDALELIRWKEIVEQVENALDTCEDLADVIESVVVKNA